MGTWAGRTLSSSPWGRQHHERRGPCRAGPGAWFMGAACHRAVRGRWGQGTQDRPGRMGAGRGWIWLLPEGVSAAPGDSHSLASHLGKMGVWGTWLSSSPPVPTHLGPGGLCPHWAGGPDLAGPPTRKPPSDQPTCVYWEAAENRAPRWALGEQRSIPQPQAWPLGAWVLTGLPSHTRPPRSPADLPSPGSPPSDAGRTSLQPSPTGHSAPRVFP